MTETLRLIVSSVIRIFYNHMYLARQNKSSTKNNNSKTIFACWTDKVNYYNDDSTMYNTSSNHMNTTTKWLRNLQGKVIYLDVTECSCAYISNCWLSDHRSSDWCITKPNKSNMTCHKYKSIDRTLEMTSDAATNAEKHVTSNIA